MQFISSNPIIDNEFFLDEEESFHLKKVLRVKKGDEIKVFDGERQGICKVIDFIENKALIKTVKVFDKKTLKTKINLYIPFIERKLFESVLKNSVEAGIFSFNPIITYYTQNHFIFDIEKKRERLLEIIKSAVKQSESSFFPILNKPQKIDDIFKTKNKFFVMSKDKIMNRLFSFKEILNFIEDEINIIVGPEGGFSDIDFSNALSENIYPVKLSDNVLRVETAAISAVCAFSAWMAER
ncbi:MAG: 16S rRNA (uracil(1498)-N(3))-methyltransferase [Elusimicrobiota bacterium]